MQTKFLYFWPILRSYSKSGLFLKVTFGNCCGSSLLTTISVIKDKSVPH